MVEKAPKLDLILDGIRRYEESIMQLKRRAGKAQEEAKRTHTEINNLKGNSDQLEGEIATRQPQVDEFGSQLDELRRANEGLQKGSRSLWNRLWQEQEIHDMLEEKIERRTDCLVEATSRFMSKVGLDNPEIPRRYLAQQEELQYLNLEATRLLCEIKVRKDNESEVETLLVEKEVLEQEQNEINSFLTEKKAALRLQLEEAQNEKEKLLEPENDNRILRMKWELSSLREEGEYLKSALVSMKQEYQALTQQLRDARPYQPGNVLSSHRGSFYHQNRQDSNRRGGRTGGGRMHGGDNTQDHSSGAPSSGWKGTLADKQGEFFFANRDSRNRDNRGYGNHSGRGKWHTNWASNDREPRPSTSGVKPSTPRTFTRNPPPPTPQSQTVTSSTLPFHKLGYFKITGKKTYEEQDDCDSGEGSPKTARDSTEPTDDSGAEETASGSTDLPAYVSTHTQQCASTSKPDNVNAEETTKTNPTSCEKNATFKNAEQIQILASDEGSPWVPAPEVSLDAFNIAPGWASMSLNNQSRPEQKDSYNPQNQRGKLHFRYQKRTLLHVDNPEEPKKKVYRFSHASESSQQGYHEFSGDPPGPENEADDPSSKETPPGELPNPFDGQFSWSDLKNLEHFNMN
ncbi:uncharacterized protein LOC122255041 isoform X2 [Penaeus japonicus]|uniref:uncharacterized protein LOC122255041 isoform X2 n=1 Tax=Penaeus japonicus TaxID=27405 RepID=UPI001C70FCDD|nr:uncharacterized protein LOC122255041 isoform X2 [Penaeus japonicus]